MDHTQQNQSAQTTRESRRFEEASIGRLQARIIRTDPLDDANWISWRTSMNHILTMCGLKGYVKGEIRRPDPTIDSNGENNWAFNDNYAKDLIRKNLGPSQTVHVGRCTTAHEMWRHLVAVHDPKDYHTMISYIRRLLYTTANDGDDIFEHLTKLKLYWDRINLGDFGFKISELYFKVIIANSLPPSWDDFIEPYVQRFVHDDPKKVVRSPELIGILRAESVRRKDRKREVTQQTLLKAKSMTLKTRFCEHCGLRNHYTENCLRLGQNKCGRCSKFGHEEEDCRAGKYKKEGKKRLQEEVSDKGEAIGF